MAPPGSNPKDNEMNGFQGQDKPSKEVVDLPIDVEAGVSGLWQASGYLNEEKLIDLRPSSKAMAVFREMRDNDPIVNSIMFAIEMLIRKVEFRVEPYSSKPDDIQNAEFLETCMEDMSHTWQSMMCEIISELTFGWSWLEIVYKKRLGPDGTDPTTRSKYNDGLIGWRKLAPRAQESLSHWVFDPDGGIQGWWQWPPNGAQKIFLPIEKGLLFRTTSNKNNPEGRSVLRGAYIPYYRKKNLERLESIGIERDVAGLPVMKIPAKMLAKDADAKTKGNADSYRLMVRNIRMDEQMGVVIPSDTDEKGHPLFELSLLSAGSQRRQVGADQAIVRYSQSIAMTVLADFVLLGHEQVGSLALAQQKTQLFTVALGAYLADIASVFNRFAIPRLFKLNGYTDMEMLPKLVPGELEKQDIKEMSQAILQIVEAGMIRPGGLDDENFWRKMVGMPERTTIPDIDPEADPENSYLQRPPILPNPIPGVGPEPAEGTPAAAAANKAPVPGAKQPPSTQTMQKILKLLKIR